MADDDIDPYVYALSGGRRYPDPVAGLAPTPLTPDQEEALRRASATGKMLLPPTMPYMMTNKAVDPQSPFTQATAEGLKNMFTLPQRAFEASANRVAGGDLDVGPAMETSMLMMGGSPFTPRGAVGAMGSKPFTRIKPPREDINTVLDANFNNGSIVGNEIVPTDSLIGGRVVHDTKRVNDLASKISDPENGYFERMIVDDENNVIEGVHRLNALRTLGIKDAPILRVRDNLRGLPTDEMESAIKAVGKIHPDHVNQIINESARMIRESGSPEKAMLEWDPAPQFKTYFDAALKAAANAHKAQPE